MNKKPIRLQDCQKHYTYDQDKACTPVETVQRFMDKLKDVKLDILKEVKRIDTGRLDIPVYFSVCGKDAHQTIGNKKQMGKGSTPEQSRASACMELGERFSFFSFIKNPENFITATYAEMKQSDYPLLPLEKLLQSVHDTTTDIGLLEQLINDIPIQWTWATNLGEAKEVMVPFSWFFAINEFNGPSAGNTYEEAINQGICEIIERHVCALVSHKHLKTPLIDSDSVTDPVARELLEKFHRNGIELYLNDFTLDTGIPTVSALAIDRSTFPDLSEIVYTAGTTPSPEKALIRALTEVAQLAGDFHTKANYVASGLPKPLSMDEVPYITHPGTSIRVDQMPDLGDNNIKTEIENMLAVLKKLDMEVYLLNTIHDKLQIPAIYTIIPGAHFRERSMINNVGLFAAKLVAERTLDPDECCQQLMTMQKLLPNAYYIDFYLGRNLHTLERYDEAMVHLQRALDQNPEDEDIPYIYSYMGNCLKDQGKYPEAITVLQQGVTHDDERPDLHNMLGVCHYKLDQYQIAVAHFQRAVELAPSSAIDYANLGVNYRKLNDFTLAEQCFELALSLDPSIDFAREQLGQIRSA
ncbi:MAG: YcaO-like family protein [Proteobacteria bacterium]|nr:tetratricopeptide repeat protein [Desulfobulbaceae bacterium]MBU4154306.1 YcaO-like family protein [Pseudomonadota bacterium]